MEKEVSNYLMSIVLATYLGNAEMEEAYDCFKRAIDLVKEPANGSYQQPEHVKPRFNPMDYAVILE